MDETLLELLTFFTRTFAEEISKYKYKSILLGQDAFIIDYVGKRSICTQLEIRTALNLSKSATSRRVNSLIEKRLISRVARETDHRWEDLTLTELGIKIYQHFLIHRKTLLKVLTHGLSKEEILVFQKAFENFKNLVETQK
jgi:MarR family transcriptional regulator, multiple antibiotic resistance protein MarR